MSSRVSGDAPYTKSRVTSLGVVIMKLLHNVPHTKLSSFVMIRTVETAGTTGTARTIGKTWTTGTAGTTGPIGTTGTAGTTGRDSWDNGHN